MAGLTSPVDEAAMDMTRTFGSAMDVMLVAASARLHPEVLRHLARDVEHFAQMVDDLDEASECYRAAAALRMLAEDTDVH